MSKGAVNAGLAVAMLVGMIDTTAARPYHRGLRHHSERRSGGGNVGAGLAAGAVLGLLGAGIAGAAAASDGYGYPAYGGGYPGHGAYGPGYGYYGY